MKKTLAIVFFLVFGTIFGQDLVLTEKESTDLRLATQYETNVLLNINNLNLECKLFAKEFDEKQDVDSKSQNIRQRIVNLQRQLQILEEYKSANQKSIEVLTSICDARSIPIQNCRIENSEFKSLIDTRGTKAPSN